MCSTPVTSPLRQAAVQREQASRRLTFQVLNVHTNSHFSFISGTAEALLVYECDHMTVDGRCHAGQTSVNILSRNRTSINSDVKSILLNRRLPELCVEPSEMEDVPQTGACAR